jgi:hypothetical protein
VEDQLFVAINYPKLKFKDESPEMPTRQHREDVSKETWLRILGSLADIQDRTPRPVRRNARNTIDQLDVGKRVEVQWKLDDRRSEWYKGTIVQVVNGRRHEYKVWWDNPDGGEQVTNFQPLTTDTEWRFIASAK